MPLQDDTMVRPSVNELRLVLLLDAVAATVPWMRPTRQIVEYMSFQEPSPTGFGSLLKVRSLPRLGPSRSHRPRPHRLVQSLARTVAGSCRKR